MKIKIQGKNWEKIAAALGKVKGHADEHCHNTAKVLVAAVDFELRADSLGLNKEQRQGLKAVHGAFDTCASAYKYRRKVTIIEMERGSKDWFLVGIRTDSVFPNESGPNDLILTKEQDQIVVDKFREAYKCE